MAKGRGGRGPSRLDKRREAEAAEARGKGEEREDEVAEEEEADADEGDEDGEGKKKRRKGRKETYSSYIYKGQCSNSHSNDFATHRDPI